VTGVVYFVGAGPGDPELLTVRAARLLRAADVVVYAGSLVPPAVLEVCRPETERIDSAPLTLEEVLAHLIRAARAGRVVVRLHSGDPSLYSALHEQLAALRDRGIPYEVVPGVSAFQAAAARLGVELTVPGLVQTVILTRAQGATPVPGSEALEALGSHRASLCVYLSGARAREVQRSLLPSYGPGSPVAVACRVGWPDERVEVAELRHLEEVVARMGVRRTVLFLASPALDAPPGARSRLYAPEFGHSFRRRSRPS
jgi:precorrin-4/cobalt-precorrin-4 C11-methyltransferase